MLTLASWVPPVCLPDSIFKWQIQPKAACWYGVISCQAGTEHTCYLAVGCSLCGVFRCNFLAWWREATQQSAFVTSGSLTLVWFVWAFKLTRTLKLIKESSIKAEPCWKLKRYPLLIMRVIFCCLDNCFCCFHIYLHALPCFSHHNLPAEGQSTAGNR